MAFSQTFRDSTGESLKAVVDAEPGSTNEVGLQPVLAAESITGSLRSLPGGDDITAIRAKQEHGITMGEGSNLRRRRTRTQSTDVSIKQEKARRRFVRKYFRQSSKRMNSSEKQVAHDTLKKAPWYKRKDLKHKQYTLGNQLQATVFAAWINVLLLAAPVGIAFNYAGGDGATIFAINLIAMVPLAGMISYAIEEIAMRGGDRLSTFLNTCFGNTIEAIIAITALVKNEAVIVQTSLLGGILSNLLLVIGMSFFFGGLSRHEQYFNQAVASTAASLLALAVASVMIPTAYDYFNTSPEASIASISRGTAIIISVVYGFYLWFQLKTHPDMFNKENPRQVLRLDQTNSINRSPIGAGPLGVMSAEAPSLEGHWSPENWELGWQDGNEEQEDEPEEPQLHLFVACITLVSSVGIAILCAQFVVENIAMNAIALEFVGLILIPTVASTTKIITAVSLAVKDKMDLSLAIALESGLQISLLLIPALVWLGWILGNGNMTLSFDMFQVAVLVVAVFLVNTLIKNGRSHWVEGLLLQSLYLIFAVCAWFYPRMVNTEGYE